MHGQQFRDGSPNPRSSAKSAVQFLILIRPPLANSAHRRGHDAKWRAFRNGNIAVFSNIQFHPPPRAGTYKNVAFSRRFCEALLTKKSAFPCDILFVIYAGFMITIRGPRFGEYE